MLSKLLFLTFLSIIICQHTMFVIGDTQRTGFWEKYILFRESNDSIPFILFNKINELGNDSSITIHLGDMVYSASDDNDWSRFDSYTKQAYDRVFPVLGNHEYFGNLKSGFSHISFRFPYLNEKSWYSRKFNGLGLIFLNSNFNELSPEELNEQFSWFQEEVNHFEKSEEISGILIFSHHPPFTNGKGVGFSSNLTLRSKYLPLLKFSTKVKLFLSGHCHSYERFIIDNIHFVVSGGGGGPRRSLDLNGEFRDLTGINDKLRDFHFLQLEVFPEYLMVICHMYNKERKEWYIEERFSVNLSLVQNNGY
jgi:hypothetical protein